MMTVFAETVKVGLSNIKLHEELQQQATQDPLTGLYNRRYLNDALEREMKHIKRNSETLCVAFFDLDHFKKYNDLYGHEAGDEVLKTIADILTKRIRKIDILCRYGGEEFVLVLVNTNIDKVMFILEQFREEMSNMKIKFKEGYLESVTISMGLAEAPKHGVTVDTIIQSADDAMYEAKKLGGNRIIVAGSMPKI
jgi:diguanylate cyclase (GGDEF)-like protein